MCIAKAMVALDEVVEVWTQPQFARVRHHPFRFQGGESCWIGYVFISYDDARCAERGVARAFELT